MKNTDVILIAFNPTDTDWENETKAWAQLICNSINDNTTILLVATKSDLYQEITPINYPESDFLNNIHKIFDRERSFPIIETSNISGYNIDVDSKVPNSGLLYIMAKMKSSDQKKCLDNSLQYKIIITI